MSTTQLGFLLASAALVGIGLFFLLYVGLGELRRLEEWEARAIRTVAEVVRHEARSNRSGTFHCPVVRYTTRTGVEIEAEVARPRRRPDPAVGGTLDVLYDPAAPLAPRMPGQDRGGAVFMMVLGGVLFGTGAVMGVLAFGR